MYLLQQILKEGLPRVYDGIPDALCL